ncbi:MAG: UPF0758 domain-containing protein, partial [Planctomycetota bacterium]
MPTNADQSKHQQQRRRLHRILDLLIHRDEFDPKEIARVAHADVTSAAVVRILRQMHADGLLRFVATDGDDARFAWQTNVVPWQAAGRWIRSRVRGKQITSQAPEDRPREKLMRDGASSLALSELFAVLIGHGVQGHSASDAG